MAETKGIVIEFKGETVEFDKSLDGVNKGLKTLKSEMSTINKKLKLDPSNIDLLKDKFKNLQQQQKLMTEQVEMYKKEIANISKEDIGSKEWLALNKQLDKAETELARLNGQLASMPNANVLALSKNLEDVGNRLTKIGSSLEQVGKKLSVVSGVVGGLGVLGVKYNAQLEQYQVALTTLLGSTEKAEEVMKQIQEDASKTPFDVDSLTKANSLLISAGVSAEESRDVIIALGDAISATGGGSSELSRMAQNMQQIKNVGKATAMDIRQFANAGINIYGLLADYMGITTEEVKDMDISFEVLSEALKYASQEGGKYFGAMETQSQTLNGLISTLKDTMSQLLGELTQSLVPIIKRVIDFVNRMVERIKSLDDRQKGLITKIGLILTALAPTLVIVGKLVSGVGGFAKTMGELLPKISQFGGSLSNVIAPIGAVVGALALLYATNEDFRNAVNGLVKEIASKLEPILATLGEMFKYLYDELSSLLKPVIDWIGKYLSTYIIPAISTLAQAVLPVLKGILDVVFGIVKQLVEWMKKLWAYLEDRGIIEAFGNAFESIGDIIMGVVNWVKELFGWFSSLIDKAKEFLGVQSQVNAGSIGGGGRSGGGYRSDGYGASGYNLSTNVTIQNYSTPITSAMADMIVNRVNTQLGRMLKV